MLRLIGVPDLVAADEDASSRMRLVLPRMRRGVPSSRPACATDAKALFDDVEPVAALATALDGH